MIYLSPVSCKSLFSSFLALRVDKLALFSTSEQNSSVLLVFFVHFARLVRRSQ